MKLAHLAAMPLLALPSIAQAQTIPFDIEPGAFTRDAQGGCHLTLALTNNYSQTLRVSATATLSNLDKTALGDANVSFPPAVPSGKSIGTAEFYHFKLAGGLCPTEFDVDVTTDYCFITGTSSELSDAYCKTTVSFNIRKRVPG